MDHTSRVARHGIASGQRTSSWLGAIAAMVFAAALALPTPARAVDVCLVLLCLAAPSWRAIPQCVPPVQQVFKDLAKGKPFPTCSTSGAGSSARRTGSDRPDRRRPRDRAELKSEESF